MENQHVMELLGCMTKNESPCLTVKVPDDNKPLGQRYVTCKTVHDLDKLLCSHRFIKLTWMEDGQVMCTCTVERIDQSKCLFHEAAVVLKRYPPIVEFDGASGTLTSLSLPEIFIQKTEEAINRTSRMSTARL